VEVTNTMGADELVRKYLESDAGSDLLAGIVRMAAELLVDADVDLLCGAGYGERSDDRVNSRNGHRVRVSYLPSLLEPRRRGRTSPGQRGLPGLRRRSLDPSGRRPGAFHGERRDVQVPSLRPGQEPRHTEKSSASTSSPPRTGPAGQPSCAAWWPVDSAEWLSSSPTPTRD
jgi:Transposase, Mutator family